MIPMSSHYHIERRSGVWDRLEEEDGGRPWEIALILLTALIPGGILALVWLFEVLSIRVAS